MARQKKYEGEELLVSARDGPMLDMLEAALQEAGIPFLRRYYEADAYMKIYTGLTSYHVDLYVPSVLIEGAHDIAVSLGMIEEE